MLKYYKRKVYVDLPRKVGYVIDTVNTSVLFLSDNVHMLHRVCTSLHVRVLRKPTVTNLILNESVVPCIPTMYCGINSTFPIP
jgi:hypothetical protein